MTPRDSFNYWESGLTKALQNLPATWLFQRPRSNGRGNYSGISIVNQLRTAVVYGTRNFPVFRDLVSKQPFAFREYNDITAQLGPPLTPTSKPPPSQPSISPVNQPAVLQPLTISLTSEAATDDILNAILLLAHHRLLPLPIILPFPLSELTVNTHGAMYDIGISVEEKQTIIT